MITKLFRSNFRSGQNYGLKEPKMSKISSFSRLSNNVSENFHYHETIIAMTNPKTAFERELYSPSQYRRQIQPKVNSLASRGHWSQKSCFWVKSFAANTFSFLYVQQKYSYCSSYSSCIVDKLGHGYTMLILTSLWRHFIRDWNHI